MALRPLVIAALSVVAVSLITPDAQGETMSDTLRVAIIQMAVSNEVEANLDRIRRGIREAGQAGARVVVFPGGALAGDTVPDPGRLDEAQKAIGDAARTHQVYVLYGAILDSGKDRPCNAAVLVAPDGEEVARYDQMAPDTRFQPGERSSLVHIDGVPCTILVGRDGCFPELVRIPALSGAQVCFHLGNQADIGPDALGVARAAENGVWVVQSIGFAPHGGSGVPGAARGRIIDPSGAVKVEAPAMEDRMVLYDIRPDAAQRASALQSLEIQSFADLWRAGVERMRTRLTTQPAVATRTSARLALMQSVPEKWNLEANFEVFLRLLDEASKEKAEIFVTPEGWLDGYASADKGVSTPEKLRGVAQDLEASEYLQTVAEEARKRSMFICFGFTSLEDGKIYNAAGLWSAEGELIGVYHKTHLQSHDLQYSFGEDLPVWPTPWGPVGIMICADRRWPETARTLRLKGAKLILNPTYGMHHLDNEWWMRTRGYENQCYIAFTHPKVGFVVDPKGDIAAKRDSDPGVLICDVDLTRAKDDNHIRDRRPELYQIIAAPKKTDG